MNFKRRLIVLGLIFIFCFGFVGCSYNNANKSKNNLNLNNENLNVSNNSKPYVVGVAVYQNTPYNAFYNRFLNDDNYKNTLLSSIISNTSCEGTEFLSVIYLNKDNNNEDKFVSNDVIFSVYSSFSRTNNYLNFDIEVAVETTDIAIYVVMSDYENNFSLKPIGHDKFYEDACINLSYEISCFENEFHGININLEKYLSVNCSY